MKELVISPKEEGQRLDKYLKKYFKEASSGFLYKMLRKKNITLNKKKATGQELLHDKDKVQVFFSEETFAKMQGLAETASEYEQLKRLSHDLDIIYEDWDILILNKPAGILSQKATDKDVSINEQMLSYLINQGALSLEDYACFHPSVANRLDRNTSGLLLAGKTLQGQQNLSKALNDRSLKKIYHCVVKGVLTEDVLLEGYLEKDEVTNTVSLLQEPKANAKPIKTFFHPLTTAKDTTLLEVQLFTGRTHQIRAHLSYLGHPILGDPKYGDLLWNQEMKKKYGVKSQLLHAYSLTFADGRCFVAPEPELFQRVMQ